MVAAYLPRPKRGKMLAKNGGRLVTMIMLWIILEGDYYRIIIEL